MATEAAGRSPLWTLVEILKAKEFGWLFFFQIAMAVCPPSLRGHRCQSRQRFAVGFYGRGDIANDIDVCLIGSGQEQRCRDYENADQELRRGICRFSNNFIALFSGRIRDTS